MSNTPDGGPPGGGQRAARLSGADKIWAGLGIAAAALLAPFLIVVSSPHDGGQRAQAAANGQQWIADIQTGLGQRGYDWVKIDVRDGVAAVSGQAPDVDSRQYGFEAAKTALARADTANTLSLVVDATGLEGGPAGVGAAGQSLAAAPTVADCQAAFAATTADHPITFAPGSADFAPDSDPLLDALAALALHCRAFRVEIASYTEETRPPALGLRLSQDRADAVRTSLRGRGAPESMLTARGLGGERPLDPARTPAADARNRRVEFTVSAS